MIVVADTTPLNYLVLIGHQEILAHLYGQVIVPEAVALELSSQEAPAPVRLWLETPPSWLQVKADTLPPSGELSNLDPGEREAIELAEEMGANLVLLDESLARREAALRHLTVIGTLGVLREASIREMPDLRQAIDLLRNTNFHVRPTLLEALLEEDSQRHTKQ